MKEEKTIYRTMRENKGYTQKDLSDLLNISQSTISKLESGAMDYPSIEDLKRYARFFNVTTDYLLGLEPTSYKNPTLKDFSRKTHLSEKAINTILAAGSAKENNQKVWLLDQILSNKEIFDGIMTELIKLCLTDDPIIVLNAMPKEIYNKDQQLLRLVPSLLDAIKENDPETAYKNLKSKTEAFVKVIKKYLSEGKKVITANEYHPF